MRTFFYILFLCSTILPVYGQKYHLAIQSGTSIYNGDLGHHSILWGNSENNLTYGVSIGADINNHISFYVDYNRMKLEGSDATSKSMSITQRNLSFYSTVNEFSFHSEIKFLQKIDNKESILKPFLLLGVGIFKFDPMTTYDSKEIRLQPLRTEGQGLPGSNIGPYDLLETNLQLGLGVTYNISNHVKISLISNYRFLQTDYLDDVSSYYYDPMILEEFVSENASKMAYRTYELGSDLPIKPEIGSPRGNKNRNDSYLTHTLRISYSF